MVCDMLDSEIITPSDFDLIIATALDMKPPFTYMNQIGVDKALALVEAFAAKYSGMPVSQKLKEQAASGKPWEILDVLYEKKGDVAVITIRQYGARGLSMRLTAKCSKSSRPMSIASRRIRTSKQRC
jgi:hypothetical protein